MAPDEIGEYRVGDRIETHPATDLWMRGDRYGTITRVGRKYLSVDMDRSGHRVMLRPRDVIETWAER